MLQTQRRPSLSRPGYGMHGNDSLEAGGMIEGEVKPKGGFAMANVMGDIRVAGRFEWLIDRIVATGSLVLRRLGGTRAGEVAVQRFFASPYTSAAGIVETLARRTAQQCIGRRVVAVQDTSEINFKG